MTVIVTFDHGKLIPPAGYRLSKLGQSHTFPIPANSLKKTRQFRVDPDNYRFLEKA